MSKNSLAFISRGNQVLSGGTSGFISLNDGETVSIYPLVNFDDDNNIRIQQHAFWKIGAYFPCIAKGDEECPGCEMGDKPTFRAFIPVVTEDGEISIFPYSKTVGENLAELNQSFGGFTGYRLNVTRRGTKKNTRYIIIPTQKMKDVSEVAVPDTVKYIGPITRAGILELLQQREEKEKEDGEGWDQA